MTASAQPDDNGSRVVGNTFQGPTAFLFGEQATQINYFVSAGASAGTWTDGVAPPPMRSGSGQIDSPYRGLRAFDERDAAFFCGRERATDQVLEHIEHRLREPGLLVVSGVSGAGKSSLLRAGVLPKLRTADLAGLEPAAWPCVLLAPGRAPLEELAVRVGALAKVDGASAAQSLAHNPAQFALIARQAAHALPPGSSSPDRPLDDSGKYPLPRLVLIIDQFEQIFTQCSDEQQRRDFVTALHAAATIRESEEAPAALVVLAVRADFEARCADYPQLNTAVQNRYLVTGMTQLQLRMAITEPPKQVNATVDDGLVKALLDETQARPGVSSGAGLLPLLSHALDQAWRIRRRAPHGEVITLGDYEKAGGIEGAVAASAQSVHDGLSHTQQAAARQIFLRLTATGDDGTVTADRALRSELLHGKNDVEARDVDKVLESYVGQRLLTLAADTVEISHEVLLTAWPKLRDEWLADTRAERITVTRLRLTAAEWDQNGHDASYLYTGSLLDTATISCAPSGSTRHVLPLGPIEQRFLYASTQARQRRIRRRRGLIALLTIMVLTVAIGGAVSARQRADAARKAAVIRSTNLAADAHALTTTDPGLAAQLAVAAYRSAPTQDATDQLYAMRGMPLNSVVGATGHMVLRIATRPETPLAAAIDDDGSMRIWNLAVPLAPALDATIHTTRATGIALAPRGTLLAGPCLQEAALCLWSLAAPRHPSVAARLPGSAGPHRRVSSIAFNSDGTLLAAASPQGTTMVWSLTQPASPRLIAELPNPSHRPGAAIAAAAFAPNGNLLATTILGGTTQLWNLSAPSAPTKTAQIKNGYAAVAFSPNGRQFAAVGDGDIGIWNITTPSRPTPIRINAGVPFEIHNLMGVAFSPDGSRLAYGGLPDRRSALCLLKLSPADPAATLDSQTCTTTGFGTLTLAYAPSGALLSGGPDGNVRSWRIPSPHADDLDLGSSDQWATSPSGHLMAAPAEITSSTSDPWSPSPLGIWDLSASHDPARDTTITLPGSPQQVHFLSESALLIVAHDGTVQLWNLRDPRHPTRAVSLTSARFPLDSSSFILTTGVSADDTGHLVAVQGNGLLHLWRITNVPSATEIGSIPLRRNSKNAAYILGDTALVVTDEGIDWWNISDPAHPIRGDTTPLPTASIASLVGIGNAPSGNLVAMSVPQNQGLDDSETLHLFNVAAGHVRSSTILQGPVGGGHVNMSGDGRVLAASGSGKHTLILWDISDLRHPRLRANIRTVEDISGTEFDPTGHLMTSWNSEEGQLWDIRNLTAPILKTTIKSNDHQFYSLSFLSRGIMLAAHGDSLFFLDTDTSKFADRICSDTGRFMTTSQWQQYAPGIAYRKACP